MKITPATAVADTDTEVIKHIETPGDIPYYIRETATLKMLQLAKVPGIVPNTIKEDGIHMAKYDGDLCDYPPQNLEDVYHIAYQIIKVMANMLQLDVVHRDIKPENILVKSNDYDHVVLCDFGLARYFSESEYPEQMTDEVQTIGYRSPELIFSHLYPTCYQTLDVWSLGVTLLNLLPEQFKLEHPPVPTSDDIEEYHQMYVDYGFSLDAIDKCVAQGLDVEFINLLASMLTVDPNNRPDPFELVLNPFFDRYSGKEICLIDPLPFIQKRVDQALGSCATPATTTTATATAEDDMLFENQESYYLYQLMKLKVPQGTDMNILHDLCVSVFDTGTVPLDKKALKLLHELDYDLLYPVNHQDLRNGLDKLFKSV